MSAVANVKHSSETGEHYTPGDIVEASREVLGVIELDPASCAIANEKIQAARYFTREENGLLRRWGGRTFLNPPGGLCDDKGQLVLRKSGTRKDCTLTGECGLPIGHVHTGVTSQAKAWWRKLARSWLAYDVECAIYIGFSIEILQSTQGLVDEPVPVDFPRCYPKDRLKFLTDKYGAILPGESPTHASVLIYLPPRWDHDARKFEAVFSRFGRVSR